MISPIDHLAQEPVPPAPDRDAMRCDCHLPDDACCAGRCTREDAHDGPCVCECGTTWGEGCDDSFGGR